jgi:hypothetical protein
LPLKMPSPTQPEKAFQNKRYFCRLGRIRSKRLRFLKAFLRKLTALYGSVAIQLQYRG